MKSLLKSIALAAGFLLSVHAQAQTPAVAPAKPAATAPGSAAPTATPTTAITAPAKVATKPGATPAAAPGGGDGKVWVNTASKTYHCAGTKYYGKTKAGEYMSEADAKAKGNHANNKKACS
jgi:hypothetical protein